MYIYSDTDPYRGEDLSLFARILRDRDTKSAVLQIDRDIRWRLFYGPSSASAGAVFLREGNERGVFPLEVPAERRSYFALTTATGSALLAETRLPLAGVRNFRDLGGLRTAGGRRVRWGRIFRSDDLSGLTDGDLAYLDSLPLVSVVDFRSADGQLRLPDRFPVSVKGKYSLTMSPGELENVAKELSAADTGRIDGLMEGIYEKLVSDPVYVEKYRRFFSLLQEMGNMPLVFHCSAGKDRTGLAAALVLHALGVGCETILADYLVSNVYLEDKYAGYVARMPNLKPLFEVKARYLQAAFDRIRRDHGSVDVYLERELSVDIPRFRGMYLY